MTDNPETPAPDADDINAVDQRGLTALHHAVKRGDAQAGSQLIELGAKADIPDRDGQTPMHCAIHASNPELVGLLLAAGAYVDYRDSHGNTLLHHASQYSSVPCLELLLDHGANTQFSDNKGRTALHWACFKPDAETARTLLKHGGGALVDVRDNDGRTPLYHSVLLCNLKVAHVLAAADADPDMADKDGKTPFTLSEIYHNSDVWKSAMKPSTDQTNTSVISP